ncbi:hypothetical protein FB451DRAFT_1387426 [Mycena latifolia]|nr:hypothetical protein FB451DRAFT_1387426 [Mycena latifolia]
MGGLNSPFTVQELVERCVALVDDSTSDLIACALVSRVWVYPAQSQFFREVSLLSRIPAKNDRAWSRLQTILNSSPHLIRHIRRLHLDADLLSFETFSAICSFPFTHVDYMFIRQASDLSVQSALSMQQLCSLPSLRHVGMVLNFTRPTTFLQIWDRWSPSIRHLELYCEQHSTDPFLPTRRHVSAHVALDSLRITPMQGLSAWLTHGLSPFDVSRLQAISIYPRTKVFFVKRPAIPLCRTAEVHTYVPTDSDMAVDLSLFPQLVVVGIAIPFTDVLPMALETLSTITPSLHIRRIVIHSSFLDQAACEQLDEKLSDLRTTALPTVELEMETIWGGPNAENMNQYFPRLSSKHLVCLPIFSDSLRLMKRRQLFQIHRENNWFQSVDVLLPDAMALQQLISLPTLRRLALFCFYIERATFLHIWDRCASSIKHLELNCSRMSTEPFIFTPHHSSAHVMLESLRLSGDSASLRDWATNDRCRFEVSSLKALAIGGDAQMLRSPQFIPALLTIKVLDFVADDDAETRIDPSSFPELALLRLSVPFPRDHSAALEILTLLPSSHLRKIVLYGSFLGTVSCEALDSKLSHLSMPMSIQHN